MAPVLQDAFEAVVGAATAGLMRIEVRLQEAIERAIEAAPLTPDRIGTLSGSFDVHLKYARQIDRFSGLVKRRAAERRANRPTPSAAPADNESPQS